MSKGRSVKNIKQEKNVDEETESQLEEEVDNFGVNFIFERALRRLDVQAEQRKVQQLKYDSHLKQLEGENDILELKLSQKDKDFVKLKEKIKALQKEMVEVKTERDVLEMKLQLELKATHRLNRDVANLEWSKGEILSMINRSEDIDELRKKMLAKRLH